MGLPWSPSVCRSVLVARAQDQAQSDGETSTMAVIHLRADTGDKERKRVCGSDDKSKEKTLCACVCVCVDCGREKRERGRERRTTRCKMDAAAGEIPPERDETEWLQEQLARHQRQVAERQQQMRDQRRQLIEDPATPAMARARAGARAAMLSMINRINTLVDNGNMIYNGNEAVTRRENEQIAMTTLGEGLRQDYERHQRQHARRRFQEQGSPFSNRRATATNHANSTLRFLSGHDLYNRDNDIENNDNNIDNGQPGDGPLAVDGDGNGNRDGNGNGNGNGNGDGDGDGDGDDIQLPIELAQMRNEERAIERDIEREIVRDMNYMRRATADGNDDADLRLFNERVRAYLRQRQYRFVDDNEDIYGYSEDHAERANLRWALRAQYDGAPVYYNHNVQHNGVAMTNNQPGSLVCDRSRDVYRSSQSVSMQDQSMLPGPCDVKDYEGWMNEDCQRLIPLSATASTTDHVSQCASNVLRNDEHFWSSTGSADGMREESLTIRLINPLNRIRAVQVRDTQSCVDTQ